MSSKYAAVAAAIVTAWLAGGADQAKRPHFIDVAPRSAIAYVTRNDLSTRKYFQQPMAGGVALLDFDHDGWLDIFFTNGAKLPELKKTDPSFYHCLLRNRHDGTFEDVTERAGVAGKDLDYSYGVAAADYDSDGFPDLFIANTGRNALYHNNGDGTFSDVTERSGLAKPANTLSVHAAWFDYDEDGRLDLVVANYATWTPATDRRCARGAVDVYCSPKTYPSVPNRLYHNLGGGRFEDVTETSGFGKPAGKGMGIAVADFNDDGRMDVFVANDTEPNFLYLNQGGGRFRESGLMWGVAYDDNGKTVSAMGADARDYDNDGRPDVFYNNLMGQTWALFRNLNGRSFQYVSLAAKVGPLSQPYSGWSGGFIDYNNDGWKDLFSANGDVDNLVPNAVQHDTLFENVGGREFIDVSKEMGRDFLRAGFQRGAAFGDLNNDGFMDIVATSLNQKPRILMNSAGNGNHWLMVRAHGARVKIATVSGRTLHNHDSASVGFLSSSDPRIHFGLGPEKLISKLEVRWPGGKVTTLTDVPADRLLTLDPPR